MKLTYTAPVKLYSGLWETTVKDEKGWTVSIVKRTTKKSMLTWIKENLKGADQVEA